MKTQEHTKTTTYIARDYKGEPVVACMTGKILLSNADSNLFLLEISPGRFRTYYGLQISRIFTDIAVAMADFSTCFLYSQGYEIE